MEAGTRTGFPLLKHKHKKEGTRMGLAKMYELIGPAGVALILVAAAGLYLTIWTVIYLIRTGRGFRSTIHEAEADGGRHFRERTEGNLNPLVCVVREVVFTHGSHSNDIRAEVAYLFHKHLAPVNNSMCWLKLIAAISPLLGLLGTVLGMVGVFQTIAVNQALDPAALASGIWQALLTTVMGLVIAIPVLMVYYCLLLRIKGFRIEAVEHSYRALELVQGGRPTLEKEAKAQAETPREAGVRYV